MECESYIALYIYVSFMYHVVVAYMVDVYRTDRIKVWPPVSRMSLLSSSYRVPGRHDK